MSNLTERQIRERNFHAEYATRNSERASIAPATDVISTGPRRWWNGFWSTYDIILSTDLAGKRVLIPGCGFGEDVLRLAKLGAEVYGFDLSPDIIEISKQRAKNFGFEDKASFSVMPSEAMIYPDNFFDIVLFIDILHHVDIKKTMAEVVRVMKPGGKVIGNELYTHSAMQSIRDSRFVTEFLYARMQKYIYRQDNPYITEDEHKIDESEFAIIRENMTETHTEFFGILEGRLFPNTIRWASKIDKICITALKPLASLLGSRVIFHGIIKKDRMASTGQ